MRKTSPQTNHHGLGSICWLIGGMFVVTGFSQVKLQMFERDSTLSKGKATRRYIQYKVDHAVRGAILTANGKPLAIDDDSANMSIEFAKVPHNDAFFMELSAASGISADEFASAAGSGEKTRIWRQVVTPNQADAIGAVKTRWRADGISVARTGRRDYPLGDAAACLVGLITDGKPKMGLEKSLNYALRGINGLQSGLADKNGSLLPTRTDEDTVVRRDGKNVVLTVDSDLQAAASMAVKDAVEAHKADNGVAIVISPTDGRILAMANWPSFSPYNADGSDGDLSKNSGYNPAYMSTLEPGSMFKILTLAKALDDKKVSLSDQFNCQGAMNVDGVERWKIHCDDHKAHHEVTPELAIAMSCNLDAATWALRIGRPAFVDYVKSLGLWSKTKLGLPKETFGKLNSGDWAKDLQLANMGYGQSISATPVALAGAFSMIANGGMRVQPRIVDRVGGKLVPMPPSKRIVSQDSADKVRQCMEAVIMSEHGTGKKLRIPGYRLAGKTGTAQKIGRHLSGHVSNFVGFVPAQSPKAVILVMINNPKGAVYHGSDVAGPAFVQIAKSVIQRYAIPPTEPAIQGLTMNR